MVRNYSSKQKVIDWISNNWRNAEKLRFKIRSAEQIHEIFFKVCNIGLEAEPK